MKVYSPSVIEQLDVSGSATITGSLEVTGTVSASGFSGNVEVAQSASYINLENVDGFTNYSSSVNVHINSLETESGSIRTDFTNYTSSTDNRLSSIETESGSIRTDFSNYTSSADLRLGSLESESGSIRSTFNSYTGSSNLRLNSLETESGSIRTTLNNYTSSADLRLGALETESGSIRSTFNSYTSSTDIRLGSIETESGSIRTDFTNYTSSTDNRLSSIETESGSIRSTFNSYTGSSNLRLNSLETESGSIRTTFNSYTGSSNLRLNSLETESGSIRTDFTNYTSSTDNRLSSIETESGSIRSTFNNFTSSVEAALTFDVENITTNGNLTVAGDLLVQGTQSIFNTETFTVENNIIELNTAGAIRGGILVGDITAPSELSGSLLWDAASDHWVAGISGSEHRIILANEFTNYTSSVDNRLSSVETESGSIRSTFNSYTSSTDIRLGSLETESGSIRTTFNSFTGSSNLRLNSLETESGSIRTTFNSFTGSSGVVSSSAQIVSALPAGTVSGSSQIDHNSTTNYVSNQHIDHTTVNISAGSGLSGGGSIASTRTLTLDTGSTHFTSGVKNKLNTDTVVSSSAQIVSALPAGTVSGSSQIDINSTSGTLNVNKGGTGQTTYTDGQLLIGNTTGNTLTKSTLTAGTGITVTNGAGTITIAAINNGTVTSVGGTGSVSGLTLSGTVTSTGNITLGGTLSVLASNFSSQTANTFLAAPNGSPGVPTFRTIVAADVPTLNQSTTGNASTATALQNTRTLWGQNFNGSDNVSGNLTSVGNITGTAGVTLTATSGSLGLVATGANVITATTNGTERLRITSDGNLLPGSNNAYDLGATGTRFRDGFFGRDLSVNGNTTFTGKVSGSGSYRVVVPVGTDLWAT